MKKITFILMFVSAFSLAADLYVFPGGTSPNYSSINDALQNASDGDRILIANSVYTGPIDFPTNLSVTLLPLTDGDTYEQIGNVTISPNSSSNGTKNSFITIHGMILRAPFTGNTSNSSSSSFLNLNIVNCVFHESFNPNREIVTNIYYSNFKKNAEGIFKEIIGNEFSGNNAYSIQCYHVTHSAIKSYYSPNFVLKVYANKFRNYILQMTKDNSNYTDFTSVHIANNFFINQLNNKIINLSNGNVNCDYLIENNTFRKTNTSYSSGWIIYCTQINGRTPTHIIRNNVIYDNNWNMSYHALYYESGSSGVSCIFENNIMNSLSRGAYVSTVNGSSDYMFYVGGITSGSIKSSKNILNSDSYLSSDISDSTGIYNLGNDLGKDIMDCRDIDDTRNDVGTYGGPNSWKNFHENQQSNGKGRIINLDIPSVIYGLPNVNFDIKSKAIRLN